MSSTPMRTPTAFRRVATVTRPNAKRSAPTTRKCVREIMRGAGPSVGLDLLAGDDHGADERSEEDERGDLEGEEPLREEAVADRRRGRGERGGDLRRPRGERGDREQHR